MKLFITFRKHCFSVTIILFAVITLLSFIPNASPHIPFVSGDDKIQHLIAYSALMFTVALRQSKYWIVIGVILMCWSGIIELLQPIVHRQTDWGDMIANSSGIVLGAALALFINYLFITNTNYKESLYD